MLTSNKLAREQVGENSTFPAALRTATFGAACLLPREGTVNWTMNDPKGVEIGAEAEVVNGRGPTDEGVAATVAVDSGASGVDVLMFISSDDNFVEGKIQQS